MTKINMVGEAKKRYAEKVGSQVSVAFGIALAIYCILVIHQRWRIGTYDAQFVMSFLTLFLAGYIIWDKERNLVTTMGLYCIGMAFTRLPSAMFYIFGQKMEWQYIAIGVFFLIISINMLYSAWEYLHGICRGYISSTVIILFLWLMYSGLFAASVFGILPNVTGTTFERVLDSEVLLANVVLFTVYLFVLGSDELREAEELEKSCHHLEVFRSMNNAGNDAAISRKDAKILFGKGEGWKRIDNGPAELEYRFVVSYTYSVSFGTAQKWRNDDRIFVTISVSDWDETTVQATRFPVSGMKCENGDIDSCSHILFYDDKGDTYRMEIRDDNYEVMS